MRGLLLAVQTPDNDGALDDGMVSTTGVVGQLQEYKVEAVLIGLLLVAR